jgi:hypothetical protein
VLTVHGQGVAGNKVTATMEAMHLSWQSVKKVIMPPTVAVRMRRAGVSSDVAVFTADVQIPTPLPVFWSVVRCAVSDGRMHAEVRSGVMVVGPARQTAFNTLTVPQAYAFCAARPRPPYLRYAVYLHGYLVGLYSRNDGGGTGIILDRPRHVTFAILRDLTRAHGVLTGSPGMPRGGWGTTPGFLACANGKPVGFEANPWRAS